MLNNLLDNLIADESVKENERLEIKNAGIELVMQLVPEIRQCIKKLEPFNRSIYTTTLMVTHNSIKIYKPYSNGTLDIGYNCYEKGISINTGYATTHFSTTQMDKAKEVIVKHLLMIVKG